jgi:WD40 repeat protein
MARKGKRDEHEDAGTAAADEGEPSVQKRARVDEGHEDSSSAVNNDRALVTLPGSLELTVSGTVRSKEKSSILSAPTVLLSGHTEAVYSLSFDPTGDFLASSSLDKTISESLICIRILIDMNCI